MKAQYTFLPKVNFGFVIIQCGTKAILEHLAVKSFYNAQKSLYINRK